MARDSYSYLHLPMVAGIVLFAIGVKRTLIELDGHLGAVPASALCGGVALYLIALSAFTYFGYPALIGLLSALFGKSHRPAPPAAGYEPTVTMLVPAHNEAVVIGAKIANCLVLDYPRSKLQIQPPGAAWAR